MDETSLFRSSPAKSRGLLAVLDLAMPQAVRESGEEMRRGRVFLAIWSLLTFAAFFFGYAIVSTGKGGFTSNAVALIGGGVISFFNLPLVHVLKKLTVPSIILTSEFVVVLCFVAWVGSGPGDSSQWFLMLAPLIASFLLGSRWGIATAVACIAVVVSLWMGSDIYHYKFGPRDETANWFDMMAGSFVVSIVALIAFAYETSQKEGLALVANAMRELRGKNRELETLTEKVTEARDAALEESKKKSEFIVRMREFSAQQGQALERTRKATADLTDTMHAIATSVDTLATSSAASDSTVDGMSESAARVSVTAQNLVGGVEDTNRALQALTAAVAAVQAQFDDLRKSAQATQSAMQEMDESATKVAERAARTVELSDAMIRDAERGREAVKRTLEGVDDIRASARTAGEVIRTLEGRVAAIGAINSVIDEVAVETNVLALNASIIAAQAGESGAGFAIVADQMRALAARTGVSTKEITAVIRAVQAETKNAVDAIAKGEGAVEAGVTLSTDAANALEQIVTSARQATEEVRTIEGATTAQAKRARGVGAAMSEVTKLVGAAAEATAQHGKAATLIESTMSKLRSVAPDLDTRSRQQADGARSARAAIARISEMAKKLSTVQGDQRKASEQTLRAIEEIQRAQRGQDEALRGLGD